MKELPQDVKETLKEFVVSIVNGVSKWYNQNLNAGYQYAMANPVIKVDTYKLRNYADRLRTVNQKLSNLDQRLDSLYWKVGLLDILNLMHADLLMGESRKIKKCIEYLEETAQNFEAAEQRILNQL